MKETGNLAGTQASSNAVGDLRFDLEIDVVSICIRQSDIECLRTVVLGAVGMTFAGPPILTLMFCSSFHTNFVNPNSDAKPPSPLHHLRRKITLTMLLTRVHCDALKLEKLPSKVKIWQVRSTKEKTFLYPQHSILLLQPISDHFSSFGVICHQNQLAIIVLFIILVHCEPKAPITFTPFKSDDHSNYIANQGNLNQTEVGEAAKEGCDLAGESHGRIVIYT